MIERKTLDEVKSDLTKIAELIEESAYDVNLCDPCPVLVFEGKTTDDRPYSPRARAVLIPVPTYYAIHQFFSFLRQTDPGMLESLLDIYVSSSCPHMASGERDPDCEEDSCWSKVALREFIERVSSCNWSQDELLKIMNFEPVDADLLHRENQESTRHTNDSENQRRER